MSSARRGAFLTIAAVLFAALAVSNALKPLQLGGDRTGFVLLGKRLGGTANAVAGPVFALVLAAYAGGIWAMRRWALPLAWAYAAYVIANLSLFTVRTPPPADAGPRWPAFVAVYALVAVGVSAGTAWTLTRRRADLR